MLGGGAQSISVLEGALALANNEPEFKARLQQTVDATKAHEKALVAAQAAIAEAAARGKALDARERALTERESAVAAASGLTAAARAAQQKLATDKAAFEVSRVKRLADLDREIADTRAQAEAHSAATVEANAASFRTRTAELDQREAAMKRDIKAQQGMVDKRLGIVTAREIAVQKATDDLNARAAALSKAETTAIALKEDYEQKLESLRKITG